jgi:hypothetical protein
MVKKMIIECAFCDRQHELLAVEKLHILCDCGATIVANPVAESVNRVLWVIDAYRQGNDTYSGPAGHA